MSTNVVAFLLLNKFRDNEDCNLEKLISAFDDLRKELEWANKDLAFHGETADIVDYAVNYNTKYFDGPQKFFYFYFYFKTLFLLLVRNYGTSFSKTTKANNKTDL